eukprot:Gregarina_sp_Poly_1__830@NODE_119_length_13600_cov_173_393926_g106_i0_p6_GENE_NODE_119_length_13600_cov_173_393926_g106_i0NODE_119_length_13600_cov_173_393926_g106_i0_p6_ORF_typecomplete_len195_score23_30_NODE_119_length_13600_cov_173_393926_g106_i01007010654
MNVSSEPQRGHTGYKEQNALPPPVISRNQSPPQSNVSISFDTSPESVYCKEINTPGGNESTATTMASPSGVIPRTTPGDGDRASQTSEIAAEIALTSGFDPEDDRQLVLQTTDLYESDGEYSTNTHEEFQAVSRNIHIDRGLTPPLSGTNSVGKQRRTRTRARSTDKEDSSGWAAVVIKACRDWATHLCRLSSS